MGAEAASSAESPRCPICTGQVFRPIFEACGHRYEECRDCSFQRIADPSADHVIDSHYQEDREHGEMVYQEFDQNLERFEKIIERMEKHVKKGRLLDVGCSLGTSLLAARERGWEVVGIELSRPVAEYAISQWGLDIRICDVDEAGFAPESFDAILMHHTLEHLRVPDRQLRNLHGLLKPRGLLYQALPNHDSLKSRLFGASWSYGVHAGHLSHFSPRTLALLLRRTGYSVLETRTFSSSWDPHLLYSFMARLGCMDRLERWCGMANDEFDQEAYIRFITDRRLPRFVSSRLWPARLTEWLGLGEDLHMLACRV